MAPQFGASILSEYPISAFNLAEISLNGSQVPADFWTSHRLTESAYLRIAIRKVYESAGNMNLAPGYSEWMSNLIVEIDLANSVRYSINFN